MSTKLILLRSLRVALTTCAVLALVIVVAQTASACPSCKAALANQEGKGGGDLVAGFFYSIMFMLSMPFAIFGSLSGYFYMLVPRRLDDSKRQ